MARALPRKPFYSLTEVCERWSMIPTDIEAYVLEGELTLSIAVGGLIVNAGYWEEVEVGERVFIPTGSRRLASTMDLERVDAWTILREGQRQVSRFRGEAGERFEIPDTDEGEGWLTVDSKALVVRRTELERFEAEGTATAKLVENAGGADRQVTKARGAPTQYAWEKCWCEMGKTIYDPGPPAKAAIWLGMIRDWFEQNYGPDNVPCDSSIKRRLAMIWPHVKPDLSRPSALTLINGAQERASEKKHLADR